MNWGFDSVGAHERHYKKARSSAPTEVSVSDILGVCSCGHIELRPTSDFESHNGGLMVARKDVTVLHEDGWPLQRIRGRGINRYSCCNYCVNNW